LEENTGIHSFFITLRDEVFCFSTAIIDKPRVFVKPIFVVFDLLSLPGDRHRIILRIELESHILNVLDFQ